jgi:hypothetical protein
MGMKLFGSPTRGLGTVSVCGRSKTPSVNVYRSFVEFEHVHINVHPSNGDPVGRGRLGAAHARGRPSGSGGESR